MNRLGRLSLRLYSTNPGGELELLRRQVNTYQVLSEESLQAMQRQVKETRTLSEQTALKLQLEVERLRLVLIGGWTAGLACVGAGFYWK